MKPFEGERVAALKPARATQIQISKERFLELITSRETLVRFDDPGNRMRGLLDPVGRWFVVQESELGE